VAILLKSKGICRCGGGGGGAITLSLIGSTFGGSVLIGIVSLGVKISSFGGSFDNFNNDFVRFDGGIFKAEFLFLFAFDVDVDDDGCNDLLLSTEDDDDDGVGGGNDVCGEGNFAVAGDDLLSALVDFLGCLVIGILNRDGEYVSRFFVERRALVEDFSSIFNY
jgi:hypothetical protein